MPLNMIHHERNYRFYLAHLNRIGIDPENVSIDSDHLLPLQQMHTLNYGASVIRLWLIGYHRSKEAMAHYEHSA